MTVLTVRLPEQIEATLRRLAESRGVPVAEVAREALERGLAAAPDVSLLDRAGDVVGRGEGPGDLSTNPAWLDDFGR